MRPEDEAFPHLVDGAPIEVADGSWSQQLLATVERCPKTGLEDQ